MNRPQVPPKRDGLQFDVEKELDAVVGHYRDTRGTWWQRIGRIASRVLLGACLAVAAATAIVYTLDTHVRQAKTDAAAKAPAKPVPIQIIPQK